ncbi:hypothetical protein CC86DRAFT_211483 [Ophiobolus disseminans]|uniref:BTB domain-containing protein n=1 Tax=Ophiobolus disseminans TaxID=1469910 RepID=A0A6A7A469_9PLEO|nr:hypothetical protein CC86DRAFT_211483 [Ophiobolus disseminans]
MKPEWTSLREDPNTIDLSGDDTDAVLLYVQWLYTDKIQVGISNLKDTTRASRSAESEKVYPAIISAYIFGGKIMDNRFKNAIVLKVLEAKEVFECCPSPSTAAFLYEGTTASSPLRRLFIDFIVHAALGYDVWAANFKEYHQELLFDVLTEMAKARSPPYQRKYRNSERYLEQETSQGHHLVILCRCSVKIWFDTTLHKDYSRCILFRTTILDGDLLCGGCLLYAHGRYIL